MVAPEDIERDIFEVFEGLDQIGSGGFVSINDIIDKLGKRSFLIVILVIHVMSSIPIPNPALSLIFGSAAALVALQALAGRRTVWLPNALRCKGISRQVLVRSLERLQPKINYLRRHVRSRFTIFTTQVASKVVLFIVFILSFLIATLLPIGNFLISVGVVVTCLGLLTRDGLFALAGIVVMFAGALWAMVVTGGLLAIAWISVTNLTAGHIVF